ncbi:MAG: AAA family ATPase [Planctomycetota bacterium]
MERIVIVGCCGGGKTTLAYQLSRKLSIEVYDLDDYFWHAGWVVTPDEQWKEIQHELVKKDSWIISGTYSSTLDIRIDAADTVIFLDLPLWRCFWRVIKRKAKNYCRLERSLPKRIQDEQKNDIKTIKNDLEFLWYVLMFKKNYNRSIREILERAKSDKRVIELNSPKEVAEFVGSM